LLPGGLESVLASELAIKVIWHLMAFVSSEQFKKDYNLFNFIFKSVVLKIKLKIF